MIIGVAVMGSRGGLWVRCRAWAAGAMASTWTMVYGEMLASQVWSGIRDKVKELTSGALESVSTPGGMVTIALVLTTIFVHDRPGQAPEP